MTKLISLFLATHLTSLTTIINAGISEDDLKTTFLKVISNSLSINTDKLNEKINKQTSEKNLHSLMEAYQIYAHVEPKGIYDYYLYEYEIESIKRLNEKLFDIDTDTISEETKALFTSIANAYNDTLRPRDYADAKIMLPEKLILTRTENNDNDNFENSDRKKEFSASIKNIFCRVVSRALGMRGTSFENLTTYQELRSAISSSQLEAEIFSDGIYGSSSDSLRISIRRFENEYSDIDPSNIDEDTKKFLEMASDIYNRTLDEKYLPKDKNYKFSLEPEQDEQSGSERANISQQSTQMLTRSQAKKK